MILEQSLCFPIFCVPVPIVDSGFGVNRLISFFLSFPKKVVRVVAIARNRSQWRLFAVHRNVLKAFPHLLPLRPSLKPYCGCLLFATSIVCRFQTRNSPNFHAPLNVLSGYWLCDMEISSLRKLRKTFPGPVSDLNRWVRWNHTCLYKPCYHGQAEAKYVVKSKLCRSTAVNVIKDGSGFRTAKALELHSNELIE